MCSHQPGLRQVEAKFACCFGNELLARFELFLRLLEEHPESLGSQAPSNFGVALVEKNGTRKEMTDSSSIVACPTQRRKLGETAFVSIRYKKQVIS